MRTLFHFSLFAILVRLAPLALGLLGLGMEQVLACENPPFAAPMTGACGVSERLIGLIWYAGIGMPVVAFGVIGLIIWTVRFLRGPLP